MSNVFNFNRLCALIRRQWISVGRIYLMSLVIMAGIFIAFYGFQLFRSFTEAEFKSGLGRDVLFFRVPLFFILGLFFITVISSSYFSDLGQKTKAIFELMIPASSLEKFLASIFYTVILSISAYLALFFLVDFVFIYYLKSHGASSETTLNYGLGKQVVIDNYAYFFNIKKWDYLHYLYYIPFLLNALFLLGSIAYQNFQYIKTAITVIVYAAVWLFSFVYMMKIKTENTVQIKPYFFQDDLQTFQLFMTIGIILTLILWGLAFLRLKEKEV